MRIAADKASKPRRAPGFAIAFAVFAALIPGCSGKPPANAIRMVDRAPAIFPYAQGTVIPPNIAPLNFIINEPGERFHVTISCGKNHIEIAGRNPEIAIPVRQWQQLLRRSRGMPLGITVSCYVQHVWQQFAAIWDTVGPDSIDAYVVYRKIPIAELWDNMAIYQRTMRNFQEKRVFSNYENGVCVNCHSFRNNDPGEMALQIRSGSIGTPMLIGTSMRGKPLVRALNTRSAFSHGRAGLSSWHPFKEIIAFSLNGFTMKFDKPGLEPREVFDAGSDIAVCSIDNNEIFSSPLLSGKDRIETWPEWSKDGRYLYFCSAPQLPAERFREIQFDLMRLAFDPSTGTWGPLDTVVTSKAAQGSILQPRISPDGRYMLVNIVEYGDFPIDKPSSDLGLVDCRTWSLKRLSISSPWAEGWHGWSSNGRWMVFTSKNTSGKYARLWFGAVDSAGIVHAPFMLPLQKPSRYLSSLDAWLAPELVRSPVPFTARGFRTALEGYARKPAADAATEATGRTGP